MTVNQTVSRTPKNYNNHTYKHQNNSWQKKIYLSISKALGDLVIGPSGPMSATGGVINGFHNHNQLKNSIHLFWGILIWFPHHIGCARFVITNFLSYEYLRVRPVFQSYGSTQRISKKISDLPKKSTDNNTLKISYGDHSEYLLIRSLDYFWCTTK